MRKLLMLLLALTALLLPASALAAEALTWDELIGWVDAFKTRALSETPMNDPAAAWTEDGYMLIYDFATFYTDRPEMTEDTVVRELVVTSGEEAAARGMTPDIFSAEVLAAFRNDNPTLDGTRTCALLYLDETRPEAVHWAWVLRDGQRIHTIQYTAHELLEDGWTDAGLLVTVDNDLVSALRAYGLTARLDAAALGDRLDEVRAEQGERGYQAVPAAADGTTLTPFGPEDLVFSGLDFLHATPADAAECFGEPLAENRTEDAGSVLQELTYAGCVLTFEYDLNMQNPRLILFSTDIDGVEGPRCARVGDTPASIRKRFRHADDTAPGAEAERYDETAGTAYETLYGTWDTAPCGLAEYRDDGTGALRYLTPVGDRTVSLIIAFSQMAVTDVIVYLQ